ncbi:hypothetical protein CBM2629_B40163 [Cupriavidus taiwanensis]|nr:hypothetical protein CBM2629_B40163 [Cupriavidus taiwanensis]
MPSKTRVARRMPKVLAIPPTNGEAQMIKYATTMALRGPR